MQRAWWGSYEMSKFFGYVRVQILRAIKLYPTILCFTLIVAVGIAVLAGALLQGHADGEDKTKIEIGLVGDLSDSYLELGILAIQQFDASRFYVNFQPLEEEEALVKLKAGEIFGYVRIPDDFMTAVMTGADIRVTYVTENSPALLGSLIVREIGMAVSDMVMTAQNGVYAYLDLAATSTLSSSERQARLEDINITYFDLALDREALYDVQYVGFGNDLPFEVYYACAFVVVLLLLWGIVCVQLTVKPDLSLQRILRTAGHTAPGQMCAEYLSFFLTVAVSLLIALAVAGAVVDVGNIQLSFLPYYETVPDFLGLGVSLLPAVLVVTALQFFLYSLTSHLISAVILQVMATLSLSLASGFLFPLGSLPPTLRTLAEYLPTGMAFRYTSDVVTGASTTNLPVLLLVTVAFVMLSAAVRERKLREVRV